MNKRHSFKDFTGLKLLKEPLHGIVKGSCFDQKEPDTRVFHKDSTATFVNCNVNNCLIPPGCTVRGGSTLRHLPQIDGCDWEVDEDDKPVRVFGHRKRERNGLNTDPTKIEEYVRGDPR